MSLGFTLGFSIASINEVDYRIIVVLTILVCAYILILLLEIFISRFGAKCCDRKKEGLIIDEGLTESMLGNRGIDTINEKDERDINIDIVYSGAH